MTILQYVQAVGGVVLVCYAVWLIVSRMRPWFHPSERAPVDDLRLVIDLAARLRDKGHHEAVKVCEQLTHELLKPAEQTQP
ncbi:MAG: hypothetical protein RLZZ21_1362 [Planctomycetota bacterium]